MVLSADGVPDVLIAGAAAGAEAMATWMLTVSADLLRVVALVPVLP